MPNWCVCEMFVKGPKKQLDKLAVEAKAVDTEFSFDKLFPTPSELLSNDPISGNGGANWYDWRVQNWGTKWDVEATSDRPNDKSIHYGFNSAWAPPIQGLVEISKKFPKLTFELIFDEPGMMFDGLTIIKNGVVESDEYCEGDDYTGRLCGLPEEEEEEEA